MGERDDGVVLVIDVDLIAIKDCCVDCIGKFGCAHEGRFGDARGAVYVSRRSAHVGGSSSSDGDVGRGGGGSGSSGSGSDGGRSDNDYCG